MYIYNVLLCIVFNMYCIGNINRFSNSESSKQNQNCWEFLVLSLSTSLNNFRNYTALQSVFLFLFVSFRLAWNHCIAPEVCSSQREKIGLGCRSRVQKGLDEIWPVFLRTGHSWTVQTDARWTMMNHDERWWTMNHDKAWWTDHWTWGTHIGSLRHHWTKLLVVWISKPR